MVLIVTAVVNRRKADSGRIGDIDFFTSRYLVSMKIAIERMQHSRVVIPIFPIVANGSPAALSVSHSVSPVRKLRTPARNVDNDTIG